MTRTEPPAHLEAQWSCTGCGQLLDAASVFDDDDAPPQDGDVSLCIHCARVHKREDGAWRGMTSDELDALDPTTRSTVRRARLAVLMNRP